MAQTSKGTGSAKKKPSAQGKGESAPAKGKTAAAPPPKQHSQTASILLFATAVLTLLISVIPGERFWYTLHNFLRGVFGVGVFLMPLILAYTGFLVGQDLREKASGRAIWGLLLTLFCCAFVQIFFGGTLQTQDPITGERTTFTAAVKLLYENGKLLHGGGLVSGFIALPLIALFGETGAKIVIVLLVIVFLMLLTNRGIVEFLELLAKPFVLLWHKVSDIATAGLNDFMEDFDDDEDDDEDEDDFDDDWEEEEPRFFRSRARAERSAEKTRDEELEEMLQQGSDTSEGLGNFDVDVPILTEVPPRDAEDVNPLFEDAHESGTEHYQMSREEEARFRKMVEKAAEESDREAANRLPWAGESAEPDDGVYEEPSEIPYTPPPLALLHRATAGANDADKTAELSEKGKQLVDTLASFGVSVRIIGIRRGPTVTRYEIQPAAGVKISKITALADDIGLNLGGKSVRIEAPIPGKPAVGVEVPNNSKDIVTLREILESREFQESKSKLTFAVGKDIDGNVILGDIAKMPHMIIAGTTGSGKSVCTNSIIMSILYHASPDEVRMVLVDPKVVEFQPYDGVPHLLIPVVTNPQKAAGALNWAVIEMERRYALCAQYGVRDLRGYNTIAECTPELKKLPQILIIIDEFADLMMSSSKEVEAAVIRIAQKARAAGIHLIIATQRPTVDVITGLIKSNVPSRIGMSVKSVQDSRNILDCAGAETLLGNGDLLFYPNGSREPKRVQGCFCSDAEVEAVTAFLKQNGASEYDSEIIEAVEQNTPQNKNEKSAAEDDYGELSGDDALCLKAAELAVDMGQLSTTAVQRRLKLGYAKAARIVDELEERGIVGPLEGAKGRKVLMTPQELTEWKLSLAAKGNHVD